MILIAQYHKSLGNNSICPVGFRLPTQRETLYCGNRTYVAGTECAQFSVYSII